MYQPPTGRRAIMALAVLAALSSTLARADILNDRYDAARTGANLSETALSSQNVNPSMFGKLYTLPVDGAVYAQPLYKAAVTVPGVGTRNVLYVATTNAKVYAFDADAPSAQPLWQRDFQRLPSVAAADLIPVDGGNANIAGRTGIESTPVIDAATGTMYFVVRTVEGGPDHAYVQRLHAVDIATGADKFGGQTEIVASVSGSAPDAVNGVVSFDPKLQNQRASLALVNGVVLVAWAAHEDISPWHGWIMGFNASNLYKVGAICTTPDGYGGGVWQSGRGPAIDANGYAYFETGNGTWDGTRNFSNSVLKLRVSTAGIGLAPAAAGAYSFYTPSNQAQLTSADLDLSSTGSLIVPGTDVLIAGGKDSYFRVMHTTTSLYGLDTAGVVQSVNVNGQDMKSGHVYWNSASQGGLVYSWAQVDHLKSYKYGNGALASTPYATASSTSSDAPGGALALSANGNNDASAVLWGLATTAPNGNNGGDNGVVAGTLHAYNALTLSEIWNSDQSGARDSLGNLVKFVVPVVANGKVYAVTQSNGVAVYGLLASAPAAGFSIGVLDRAPSIQPGQSTVVRVATTSIAGGTVAPALTLSGLPAGVQATVIAPSSEPGTFGIVLSTASSTGLGNYPVTVTATTGTATVTDTIQLSVANPSPLPAALPIALGSSANAVGLVTDGTAPQGGWDRAGYAYSANLVGPYVVTGDVSFRLGTPNAANAASATTVAIPAGYYGSLRILGSGVNGAQTNQTFTVHYSDGTTSTTTLNMSDWCASKGYAGETVALTTSYRIAPGGTASTTGCTSVDLYTYSIPTTATKQVTSLTLPTNTNVRIAAVSALRSTAAVSVPLAGSANVTGIFVDRAATTSTGLDTSGYAFPSAMLASPVAWAGTTFSFGTPGVSDAVSSATVPLPADRAASLRLLATGVNGAQANQTFTVTYADGTSTTTSLSLSDWCSPQHYSGEAVVLQSAVRDYKTGTQAACGTAKVALYGYAIPLDPARTPVSLILPANRNVVLLAAALVPPEVATTIPLGSAATVGAVTNDGTALSLPMDTNGYTFSQAILPMPLRWAGTPFAPITPGNGSGATNTTIALPPGPFASLRVLATALWGPVQGNFVVKYSDGTSSTIPQTFSDWCNPQSEAGESIAFRDVYRDYFGAPTYDCGSVSLYGYQIPLDISRTPVSLTLPTTTHVIVLGVTAQ